MWGCRARRDRKVTEVLRGRGGRKVTEASVARPELQGWTLLVLLGLTVSQCQAVAGGRKIERL